MAETFRKSKFTKMRYTETGTADTDLKEKLLNQPHLKTDLNLDHK